ncbi:AAA family ATPase [Glutamicibacter arilaitensis]|uniref:AAA family ATPase n=1 Tax=Glutamicibacter arilaitensis TaxID=256701 RepID=UPI003FD12822
MSALHNITLNPASYELESRDGTTITVDSISSVLRVLRTHKRNNQNGTLHLLMDRNADVPWTVSAWTVALDNDTVTLQAAQTKITPTQRRQAITLRVTSYAFGTELGSYKFDTFEEAITASHGIAATAEATAPDLLITSDFEALDGIQIPAQKVLTPEAPAPASTPTEAAEAVSPAEPVEPAAEPAPVSAPATAAQHSHAVAPVAPVKSAPTTVEHEADTISEESSSQPESAARAFATRAETKSQMIAPAQEGLRGTLNRTLHTRLTPGAHERLLRTSRATVQKSLSEHRAIAVPNVKGGATKTTLSYCLGAVLGRVRGGNILVWDNNENAGNMLARGIVPQGINVKTAIDLFRDIDQFENAELSHKLKQYVLSQGDNRFYMLPSQDQGSDKQVIDGRAFDRMYEILHRFYDLIVVDTGNASNAGTWKASVQTADELVIATANKSDAMAGAMTTIDALRAQGHADKLANSVAVITELLPRAEATRSTSECITDLEPWVREVKVIPYDKQLPAGEMINFDALSPKTQEAYLHAGAAIMNGLS